MNYNKHLGDEGGADSHTGGAEYVASYSSHLCPRYKASPDSGHADLVELPYKSPN